MISPCLTPALGSILAYLATKKNVVYGMSLLICFAYGMGFILLLASASSSILINLPKSGKWMMYIKRIVAIVLVAVGGYFAFSGIRQLSVSYISNDIAEAAEQQMALDFELKDLDQNIVTLSSFKDKKPVILIFWTTWCPYCRSELNALKNEYSQLVKDGIELFAIDVGEARYKVDNFVKGRGFNFKFLLDEDATVAQDYNLLGVPSYFIINKSGKIVFSGGSFPRNKLRELLKE
jgi:peroxiredoxin